MADETQLLWIVFLGTSSCSSATCGPSAGWSRRSRRPLVEKVAPGARDVAGHLSATTKAATGLQSELDALLRS